MATCKDCLHYEACKAVLDLAGFFSYDIEEMLNAIKCPNFADKSRFVELLCKVGDTVYSVETAFNAPIESKIYEICFRSGILAFRAARKGYFGIKFTENDIGKTIFITREEAEAALAERMKKDDRS